MRKKMRLGDIYEIPLPNGKNAYGRLFKECTLAIYEGYYSSFSEVSEHTNIRFFCSVYKDILQDNKWKVVGNRGFNTDEESWPPPRCVIDAITKVGSIYYKGEISPCKYEECKELEIVAIWDRHHLVDRIMGDDKWLKAIGHPIDADNI